MTIVINYDSSLLLGSFVEVACCDVIYLPLHSANCPTEDSDHNLPLHSANCPTEDSDHNLPLHSANCPTEDSDHN